MVCFSSKWMQQLPRYGMCSWGQPKHSRRSVRFTHPLNVWGHVTCMIQGFDIEIHICSLQSQDRQIMPCTWLSITAHVAWHKLRPLVTSYGCKTSVIDGGGNWQVSDAVMLAGRSTYKDRITHSQADRPGLFFNTINKLVISHPGNVEPISCETFDRAIAQSGPNLHCHFVVRPVFFTLRPKCFIFCFLIFRGTLFSVLDACLPSW